MGRVWRGHDEVLDRPVAVKQVLLHGGLTDELRDRLAHRMLREARAAARLNHPGIVTVHDIVVHNGSPAIVTEFLDGPSLGSVIEQEGRLLPDRVAEIGAAMLDALQEAHAAGIVHRDLKPDNVLLAGRRTVITDFGIANMADATPLTAPGALMGTPIYMAPEQVDGQKVAETWDLWSLGVTLYKAVEGVAPFSGPTPRALYGAILTRSPRPTQHAGPLAEVLAGLLVKDPARRATAVQTAEALSALIRSTHRTRPNRTGARGDTTSAPLPLAQKAEPRVRPSTLSGRTETAETVRSARSARTQVTTGPYTSKRLWDPAIDLKSRRFEGHTGAIYEVAFSPDGMTLATASADGTVRLWNIATGNTTTTLELPGVVNVVRSVAFSPDSTTLATAGVGRRVQLWNRVTGVTTTTLNGHTSMVFSVAFSPDGRTLASASGDKTVRLWDTSTGRTTIILEGHTSIVEAVAFSPDGASIATASADKTVRLWDTATGHTTATLKGHSQSVYSVAFSPDGTTLATASHDSEARLWDTATGRTTATLRGHTGIIEAVAFSPDGRTLASADKRIRLWDSATGRPIREINIHVGDVHTVAFSPDGKILASGGKDEKLRLTLLL